MHPLAAIEAGTSLGLQLRKLGEGAMERYQALQERQGEAENRNRLGWAELKNQSEMQRASMAQRNQQANQTAALHALTIDQQNQRAAEALRAHSQDTMARLAEAAHTHEQMASLAKAKLAELSTHNTAMENKLPFAKEVSPRPVKTEDEMAKGKALIAAGQSLLKTDTGDPQGKAFIEAGKALISKQVPKHDFSDDVAKDPWVTGLPSMTNSPVTSLPANPAGVAIPQSGVVKVKRKSDGKVFNYKGNPGDVPTDQFDIVQ